VDRTFEPAMDRDAADQLLARWHEALDRAKGWES
jgi:hypothetical protein